MSRLINFLKAMLFTLCLPAMVWHTPVNATVTAAPTIQKVNTSTTWSPWDLLNYETLSYQRIVDFIWEVAYGNSLENKLNESQTNQVMDFVIFLTRNGLQDDDIEGKAELEEDIKWLMGEANDSDLGDSDDEGDSSWGLFSGFSGFNGYDNTKLMPAVLYGFERPNIVHCGFISKKWKQTKKFVKKHKKEVIIAAVVVVAAVVIIATQGAGTPAAVAGVSGVTGATNSKNDNKDKDDDKPKPRQPATPINKAGEVHVYDHDSDYDHSHYPSHCDISEEPTTTRITPQLEPAPDRTTLLKETLERQNATIKAELSQEPVIAAASEDLNIPQQEQPSFLANAFDKAREVGAIIAHEVYDGVTEQLSIVPGVVGYASEKIGGDYSPFEKDPREAFEESVAAGHEKIDEVFATNQAELYSPEAKEARDKLATGMLPPPGGGIKSSSRFYEKNIKHIFRSKPGHLIDTQANRKLILEVAGDSKNFLGVDKHGNSWHAKIQKDGTQVWSISRNGEVRDAGVNKKVQNFHKETGLSSSEKPKQR